MACGQLALRRASCRDLVGLWAAGDCRRPIDGRCAALRQAMQNAGG